MEYVLDNLNELQDFRELLRSMEFETCFVVSYPLIYFNFSRKDKDGYKTSIEVEPQKTIKNLIKISRIALKDIFDYPIDDFFSEGSDTLNTSEV